MTRKISFIMWKEKQTACLNKIVFSYQLLSFSEKPKCKFQPVHGTVQGVKQKTEIQPFSWSNYSFSPRAERPTEVCLLICFGRDGFYPTGPPAAAERVAQVPLRPLDGSPAEMNVNPAALIAKQQPEGFRGPDSATKMKKMLRERGLKRLFWSEDRCEALYMRCIS